MYKKSVVVCVVVFICTVGFAMGASEGYESDSSVEIDRYAPVLSDAKNEAEWIRLEDSFLSDFIKVTGAQVDLYNDRLNLVVVPRGECLEVSFKEGSPRYIGCRVAQPGKDHEKVAVCFDETVTINIRQRGQSPDVFAKHVLVSCFIDSLHFFCEERGLTVTKKSPVNIISCEGPAGLVKSFTLESK